MNIGLGVIILFAMLVFSFITAFSKQESRSAFRHGMKWKGSWIRNTTKNRKDRGSLSIRSLDSVFRFFVLIFRK